MSGDWLCFLVMRNNYCEIKLIRLRVGRNGREIGKIAIRKKKFKKISKKFGIHTIFWFCQNFSIFFEFNFFFIFGMDFMKISTHGLVHYPWHNNQNFVETRNLLNSIKFIQGPICQEIFQQRHNFPSKHRDNPRNFEKPFSIPNVTN